MQANIDVTFEMGLGTLEAKLFRNGNLVDQGSVNSSGTITFEVVERGDAISINGVCTGTADLNIDVTTDPATPKHFPAGNINFGFDVLQFI